MREGDPGDRYLAIVDGTAEVSKRGMPLVARARGDGVGETALLHDVPRTATVRATTAVHALTLSKRDFLVAVTGHAPTYATALDIATRHRGADPS
jgi:CRP-like cAMP-binding protein